MVSAKRNIAPDAPLTSRWASERVSKSYCRETAIANLDCLFCKIASGEIPSETVFEDGDVKVFKDINPKAPVHLLVVPKLHIQSIAHLDADHNDVISKIIYTARNVAKDQGLTGYKLVFNVGKEGGQVIDHLHLHILGGWRGGDTRGIGV